jgi:predicted outer membrane repeat protein
MDNIATHSGGGITWDGAKLIIVHSLFENNYGEIFGGALFCNGSFTTSLLDLVVFRVNEAQNGSDIFLSTDQEITSQQIVSSRSTTEYPRIVSPSGELHNSDILLPSGLNPTYVRSFGNNEIFCGFETAPNPSINLDDGEPCKTVFSLFICVFFLFHFRSSM